MELLIILAILAALALGMAAYASYNPVDMAVTQSALNNVPGSADFLAGWAGFLFKLAAGFLLTALFTALVAGVLIPWIRTQWKQSQGKGWKPGPNARWGREEQPKLDPEKLMTMALLSKIIGTPDGAPLMLQQPPVETPPDGQQFPEGWW